MSAPNIRTEAPSALCACGCGQSTLPATKTYAARGIFKGQPAKMLPGHYRRTITPSNMLALVASRSIPEPNTGCWLWLGEVDDWGYARMYDGDRKKRVKVSRLLLALPIAGPFTAALPLACHRCDTPACVNPDHLFVGTNGDNNADKKHKGRAVGVNGWKGRTECVNGHSISEANTYWWRGKRHCRACKAAGAARRRLALPLEGAA